METPAQEQQDRRSPAQAFGILITNLIKAGGLAVAVNESLLRTELRPSVLAIAAFMMAGATGAETLIDKLFGR